MLLEGTFSSLSQFIDHFLLFMSLLWFNFMLMMLQIRNRMKTEAESMEKEGNKLVLFWILCYITFPSIFLFGICRLKYSKHFISPRCYAIVCASCGLNDRKILSNVFNSSHLISLNLQWMKGISFWEWRAKRSDILRHHSCLTLFITLFDFDKLLSMHRVWVNVTWQDEKSQKPSKIQQKRWACCSFIKV